MLYEVITIHIRIYRLQMQPVFDAMTTAYPAAVVAILVAAAYALDHHHTLGPGDHFILPSQSLSQVQMGSYNFV